MTKKDASLSHLAKFKEDLLKIEMFKVTRDLASIALARFERPLSWAKTLYRLFGPKKV